MEVLTFLVSDYANIAQGGKLNVMGIFRDIYASSFPARHSSMTLVVKLGADLGEYENKRSITIKLFEADGNEILKLSQEFNVPKPSKGKRPEVNAIIELHDVVFPKPGRYEFKLLIDKDLKGSLDIDVIKIENLSQV